MELKVKLLSIFFTYVRQRLREIMYVNINFRLKKDQLTFCIIINYLSISFRTLLNITLYKGGAIIS